MSRLLTDKIKIYLHPQRVVLVRETGWFKRRIVDKQLVVVPSTNDDLWHAVLVCLRTVLQDARWKGKLHIVLSNHFVRFLTVPWDARLSREERGALLQYRFEDIYGDELRGATLATADAGYGKQSVACAINANMLETLIAVCNVTDVTLVSIKPFLMAALNQVRDQIDRQGAWIVLAESACLTLTLIQHGEWRSIRCSTSDDSWDQHLTMLLQREAFSSDADTSELPVYVFWPEKPDAKPILAGNQSALLLKLAPRDGYSPLVDRDFVPAMCG